MANPYFKAYFSGLFNIPEEGFDYKIDGYLTALKDIVKYIDTLPIEEKLHYESLLEHIGNAVTGIETLLK